MINNVCDIEYRFISENEINKDLFNKFIRHQVVVDCFRRGADGGWEIRKDPFIDDWSECDYEKLVSDLRNTILNGGFVYGAFGDTELKGFVSVEGELFGGDNGYIDVSNLHVSEDMRGCGIGKVLFNAAKNLAIKSGAKKLYISSHSAVETQRFYRSLGCVDAKEYSAVHVEAEPYDCQLEFVLD